MKSADYLITRVCTTSFQIIDEVEIYKVDDNNYIYTSEIVSRAQLVRLLENGNSVYTAKFLAEEKWTWSTIEKVFLHKTYYSSVINTNQFYGNQEGLSNLPKLLPKRKTFSSFYHKDDESYRMKFESLTKDLIINKSVKDGDISTDVNTDYIKYLVQDGHLSDTTVLVVLIGPKTIGRKHVDWEISGALNVKVGDKYAGLLGLVLPSHIDSGKGQIHYDYIPQRLADNFKTGYAVVADWTSDRVAIQQLIELAFNYRTSRSEKRDNSRIQMTSNSSS